MNWNGCWAAMTAWLRLHPTTAFVFPVAWLLVVVLLADTGMPLW